MNNYPQTLRDELVKYDYAPTGNIEWDKAVLLTLQQRNQPDYCAMVALDLVMRKVQKEVDAGQKSKVNINDPSVFNAHIQLWKQIANKILRSQRREFVVDDNNREVIRFLMYYFHESPRAEELFPGRGYKIHKNIMLQGKAGAGKTLLMQVFSAYLKYIESPMHFECISVTQMVNHFSLCNNIDLYTYNEDNSKAFQIKPFHLCLNDIGLENRPFYGIDTTTVINDFLHARNELWSIQCDGADKKFAHLTTNLTTADLAKVFNGKDPYGRTIDRFKTYNVIPLPGESRR